MTSNKKAADKATTSKPSSDPQGMSMPTKVRVIPDGPQVEIPESGPSNISAGYRQPPPPVSLGRSQSPSAREGSAIDRASKGKAGRLQEQRSATVYSQIAGITGQKQYLDLEEKYKGMPRWTGCRYTYDGNRSTETFQEYLIDLEICRKNGGLS